MKILFFSENFPPETNAAATRVYERACYWVKDGHEVTVITQAPNFPQGKLHDGYKNKLYQAENISGIHVVRVKTYIAANSGLCKRTLDFLSFMMTSFIAGLFQKRADIICATSPQFFCAVSAWAVSAIRRTPFVFELGDLWPASIRAVSAMKDSPFINLMEKIELFLYRKSAAVAALTRSFKDNLVHRQIDAKKIAIVINGVDSWRYAPKQRDKELCTCWGLENKFVIGYIGTHGMAHALTNVLSAAQILHDDPDILFLFVGDGAERQQLITRAKDMGLTNVCFRPPEPKSAMPNVWSLCDVALVHLKNNPVFAGVIPSKIFEAMGMGLAQILAAPLGEASQIIEHSKSGLHVPPENPEALAKAVAELKTDQHLLKTLAANSLKSARDYSRKVQADKMIDVFNHVLQNQDVGHIS